MKAPVTFAIAGFGGRGGVYANMAKLFPDRIKVVAVADIIPEKVMKAKEMYDIADDMCFASAEEMLAQPKLADVVCICTMDRQHVEQGIAALERGYDIVLEKPISPELEECQRMLEAASKSDSKIIVCHVLRYTPFYNKLYDLIHSGAVGEVINVQASENVAYWHQAHSFVRGNWGNSLKSSPMILQKCCHDMDILLWLTGKSCKSVTSFGSTHLFKKEMAPEGSTPYCLGGCKVKENCIYDAEKSYIFSERTGIRGRNGEPSFLTRAASVDQTEEAIYEALRTGPYGRCVYHCDNDVVDHQVINMLMTDGTTIGFSMCAFTKECYRRIHIMGTMGEIVADMDSNIINLMPFVGENQCFDMNLRAEDLAGHGGGDSGMISEFVNMLINEEPANHRTTSIERSMDSHFVALAAEESRLNGGKIVDLEEFKSKY